MAIFGAEFPIVHEPETPPWLQGMGINKELISKDLANRQAAIQNQISGVQQKYAEPEAQQALQKAILFNKYYGPEKEAGIANTNASTSHMGAETNKINTLLPMERLAAELKNKQSQREYNNPLYGSTETKQIAALQDAGVITPEKAKELVQHVANNMNASRSAFAQQPADYKSAYLETLVNSGYNRQQALQHAINNDDLQQLIADKGFKNIEDVPTTPSTPTGSTRSRLQQSNIATSEIEKISPDVDRGLAHYAGQPTLFNTPIGFYKDALTGKNKDKQSDFIMATTLAQEEAFIRARQAGVPLGQGILKHTLETSLMNVKASLPFTTEDVYLEASNKIRKEFSKINEAANKAAYKSGYTNSDESSDISRNEKFKQEVGDTSNAYSDEDIAYTAKKYGISPEKVRERLNNGSIR